MARRAARRTRKPVDVPEDEVLDEVLDEEEEEEEPAKKPTRKARRSPRKKVPAKVVDEPEDEDEEEEPAKKPARRARKTPAKKPARRARKTRQVDPEPEDEDEDEEEADLTATVQKGTAATVVDILTGILNKGLTIAIRKVGDTYYVSQADVTEVPSTGASKRKRGERVMTQAELFEIAYTDDYKEFQTWWPKMTFEEKVDEAKKEKVEWEEHDDPLANNLRLTQAYKREFGIEKWREEYSTKAARDALVFGEAEPV